MLKKLDRPFRVMDDHLAARAYLLGDRFTVADLNVSAVMTLGMIAGVPMAAFLPMAGWLDRSAAAD